MYEVLVLRQKETRINSRVLWENKTGWGRIGEENKNNYRNRVINNKSKRLLCLDHKWDVLPAQNINWRTEK